MDDRRQDSGNDPTGPRYTWPWFLLGLVILGVLLAVLWMSHEVARTRQLRDLNAAPTAPSANPAQPGPTQ